MQNKFTHISTEFQEGDEVLVKVINRKSSLDPKYTGPYKVVGKMRNQSYKLKHLKTNKIIDRHRSHLKKYINTKVKEKFHSSTIKTLGTSIESRSHIENIQDQKYIVMTENHFQIRHRPERIKHKPQRYGYTTQ